MGRKRSEKGGRRGPGRRAASQPDHRRGEPSGNRPGATGEVPGPARMLLTRVLREGAIWNVYVATTARSGAPNLTQLEFEGTGAGQAKLRCTRPVAGPLLDALHSGAPISRASLQAELELALHAAAPADADDRANGVDLDPSRPDADSPPDS
jgi:hypothetical protein